MLVWTAVLLMVFVGLVGLAIDTANVLFVAHQLQNSADAASLAGALKVKTSIADARQKAFEIALANTAAGAAVRLDLNAGNDPAGDIVVGRYSRTTRTFTPQLTATNAVQVTARRTSSSLGGPVSLFFGPIFGVNTANVSRTAIAMAGGGTGAGIIALDPHAPCGLEVQGNVVLSCIPDIDGDGIPDPGALDADIQVNSDHSTQAFCGNGNPTVIATSINVQGEDRLVGNVDLQLDGTLNNGAPPIPDPLASVSLPTWDPVADRRDSGSPVKITGGTATLQPGFYAGGITATGGNITLSPGIYILDGAGLNISGNTNFSAQGVMFYITGAGNVDLTGTGNIVVTPPDPQQYNYPGADTYEGIAFFQDRSNTTNDARIIGTSLMDLDGTLYFPSNHVYLSGTGDGFGSQLIAGTIEVDGTGNITIMYDGRNPAPGGHVFLVE